MQGRGGRGHLFWDPALRHRAFATELKERLPPGSKRRGLDRAWGSVPGRQGPGIATNLREETRFPEIFLNPPHIFPRTCVPSIALVYNPKNLCSARGRCRAVYKDALGLEARSSVFFLIEVFKSKRLLPGEVGRAKEEPQRRVRPAQLRRATLGWGQSETILSYLIKLIPSSSIPHTLPWGSRKDGTFWSPGFHRLRALSPRVSKEN